MSSEPLLPPRVTCMGEALRPLLHKVREGAVRSAPEESERVTLDVLREHLHDLEMAVNRIVDAVDGMMNEVVAAEDAGDPEIYRAVARLESRVDDLQDDRARLLHATADDRYEEGRSLLGETYLHLLGQIASWLEELVDFIADPIAAAKRKGLPTSGYVEVPFTLTVETPPQFREKFQAWAARAGTTERTAADEWWEEWGDTFRETAIVHLVEGPGGEGIPPARLERLGSALRSIEPVLRDGMGEKVKPKWLAPQTDGEFMTDQLRQLAKVTEQVEDASEALAKVVGGRSIGEEEERQAVVRIGHGIDRCLAGYGAVRARNAHGAMLEGRQLLAHAYRRTLVQMRDWLVATAETLENPLAACESGDLRAGRRIELPVGFRPETPRAIYDLEDWAEDLRVRNEASADFWSKAFAVALGAWIGFELFDD